MRLRNLVVVGLVGLACAATNGAYADEAFSPRIETAAVSGVNFADIEPLSRSSRVSLALRLGPQPIARPARIAAETRGDAAGTRRYELAVAQRDVAGLSVDVEFAQRASIGVNNAGDISRAGAGSELRLGSGLGDMRRRAQSSWDSPIWYVFAAADDEALTWQPGARNAFGGAGASFSVEDRVEIGDMQAGITMEAGRLQASLAYVQREISAYVGAESRSRDESFTGVTLTLRH